jgi:hypothetical protein
MVDVPSDRAHCPQLPFPAARIGDLCAHGGAVVSGFPTVIIGG